MEYIKWCNRFELNLKMFVKYCQCNKSVDANDNHKSTIKAKIENRFHNNVHIYVSSIANFIIYSRIINRIDQFIRYKPQNYGFQQFNSSLHTILAFNYYLNCINFMLAIHFWCSTGFHSLIQIAILNWRILFFFLGILERFSSIKGINIKIFQNMFWKQHFVNLIKINFCFQNNFFHAMRTHAALLKWTGARGKKKV